MKHIVNWLSHRFRERPWWMNLLMVFCAFQVAIYIPWDFLVKPVAVDEEVWLGIVFRGWAAKATEPLRWVIFAAGLYGFWRMRPWMWPWAALYSAQVAFSMLVWPIVEFGDFDGWMLGVVSLVPFGAITAALWSSSEAFQGARPLLRDRYGEWGVVTGASAGIGAEFARQLAREGMSVVLVARRKEKLQELAGELERTRGVETRIVVADLATPQGVDRVVSAVSDLPVAVLVNNAGVGYAGRFTKQEAGRLAEMVHLNCTAPVVLTRRLLDGMLERRRGAVIVVGSVAGRQPLPFHAVYSATKSFDLLFGEALWAELRELGIDVVVLQPGPVATEFESVAGEARVDPARDQAVGPVVQSALEALGRQPSVASSWLNWLRANANRLVPRPIMAFLAGDLMEGQTPHAMR